MVDKEEMTKTPSPLNINEAIEGEVLNQKTARSKYHRNENTISSRNVIVLPSINSSSDLNLKAINSRLFMSSVWVNEQISRDYDTASFIALESDIRNIFFKRQDF